MFLVLTLSCLPELFDSSQLPIHTDALPFSQFCICSWVPVWLMSRGFRKQNVTNRACPVFIPFSFATVHYYKEPFLHIAMIQAKIFWSEIPAIKGTAISIYVCLLTIFLYTHTLPHAYRYVCTYITYFHIWALRLDLLIQRM